MDFSSTIALLTRLHYEEMQSLRARIKALESKVAGSATAEVDEAVSESNGHFKEITLQGAAQALHCGQNTPALLPKMNSDDRIKDTPVQFPISNGLHPPMTDEIQEKILTPEDFHRPIFSSVDLRYAVDEREESVLRHLIQQEFQIFRTQIQNDIRGLSSNGATRNELPRKSDAPIKRQVKRASGDTTPIQDSNNEHDESIAEDPNMETTIIGHAISTATTSTAPGVKFASLHTRASTGSFQASVSLQDQIKPMISALQKHCSEPEPNIDVVHELAEEIFSEIRALRRQKNKTFSAVSTFRSEKSSKNKKKTPPDGRDLRKSVAALANPRLAASQRKEFLMTIWRWIAYQFTPPPTFQLYTIQSATVQFAESFRFKMLRGLGIITHSIYLGVYAQIEMDNQMMRLQGEEPPEGWWIVPRLFELWFLFELSFCMYAYRWEFWVGRHSAYNILDLIVVMVPLIITLKHIVTDGSAGLKTVVPSSSVFRAIRVVRIVHTFELFRLPIFAEFRMIMNALLQSMPSFLWAVLIGFFFLYCCSLGFMMGAISLFSVVDISNDDDVESSASIQKDFGSIRKSMMSLFMSVSNGIDWESLWITVLKMDWYFQLYFILYIVFMLFAIMNIISGMFIERAFRVINSDRDFWILEEAKEQRRYKERLLGLFTTLDIDQNEGLTWEEFQEHLSNPHVRAYLSWLGLDPGHGRDLFVKLDTNSDGELSMVEFLEGCQQYRGPATKVEVAGLSLMLQKLVDKPDKKTKGRHVSFGS